MLEISTEINQTELDAAIHALQMLGSRNLPNMARAVEQSTVMVQQQWLDNTRSIFKRSIGAYREGIQEGRIYPRNGDPFQGAVINTAPHAAFIENGTKSHDMKRALYTSSQVRVSKQGKRYLIIPFRHGTPSKGSQEGGTGGKRATMSTMPKAVYDKAKNLAVSQRLQFGHAEKNVFTERAIRYRYNWGDRLTEKQIKSVGADQRLKAHHKTSIYTGMVRLPRDNTTGQSIYLTFRVMSEDSKGWIHPGTPPLNIARKTAADIAPAVKRTILSGFEADMIALGLA